MINLVLGGPSFCRVCGHSHNHLSYNQCVASPRQEVQIALEKMKEAIADVSLYARDRSYIDDELIKKLHTSLDIPEKPIYNHFGRLKLEVLKKIKEARFDLSKQRRYEVTVLLNEINELILKNGTMTARVDASYKASFENAKNTLLKP